MVTGLGAPAPATMEGSHRAAYGHHGRVFDVAFSPDDAMLVSASEDSSARVWRCDDLSQASLLTGHTAEVLRTAWSPDGGALVTGSADRTAKLWRLGDAYTAQCTAKLEGHAEEIYCCEWLCPRKAVDRLVTVSGSTVAAWDIGDGRALRLREAILKTADAYEEVPELWRETAAFGGTQCPVHALLACPCSDGTVHVLSTAADALRSVEVLNVAAHARAAVMCLCAAFSPEGTHLAVVTSTSRVIGYDARTWQVAFNVDAPGAIDAQWLAEDTLLVALSNSILRLNTDTGAMATICSRFSRKLLTLAVSPSLKTLAASGDAADSSSGHVHSAQRHLDSLHASSAAPGRATTSDAHDRAHDSTQPSAGALCARVDALTIAPARRNAGARARAQAQAHGSDKHSSNGRAPVELWPVSHFEAAALRHDS